MIIESQQKNHELRRRKRYIYNLKSAAMLNKSCSGWSDDSLVTESGVMEYVLSPLLLTFTVWVLQQAKKDNVKTLFFLARDGYLVYKIAKMLCDSYGWDFDCKYFYCSRYSLRIPMYSKNLSEALDYICRGGIDITFRKIMIRSGFKEKKIGEMKRYFADIDFDSVIPYPLLGKIRERLKSCPEYINDLKMISQEKWNPLKEYFQQEGMFTDESVGIVDSGWTGTTQKSICDIRRYCGYNNSKIRGYYFGLFEYPDDGGIGQYRSFYFDSKNQLLNKLMFSNCLFEAIVSANHGTSCGFSFKGKVLPELQPYKSDPRKQCLLDTFYSFGKVFVEQTPTLNIEKIPIMQYKRALQKSLRIFMWNPTKMEAEFFGKFKFSDDLLDQTTREVAPLFSDQHLMENHLINKLMTALGIRKTPIHESAWYEASAVRNGKHSLHHRISNSIYKLLSYIKKGI